MEFKLKERHINYIRFDVSTLIISTILYLPRLARDFLQISHWFGCLGWSASIRRLLEIMEALEILASTLNLFYILSLIFFLIVITTVVDYVWELFVIWETIEANTGRFYTTGKKTVLMLPASKHLLRWYQLQFLLRY